MTPELVKSLTLASTETGRQVGALVHRSGQIDYVIVGDASKLMLPDIGRLRAAEGRFRGLRLIHTHIRGEALSRDDLVDLVRLRLDLVAAIHMAPGGEPRGISYAYNVPTERSALVGGAKRDLPYHVEPMTPVSQVNLDVGELMRDLEAEFAKMTAGRAVEAKDGRAILVHVDCEGGKSAERRTIELRELARTAGVEVADTVIQAREQIDPKFVLGKGKLEDVVLRAIDLDASVLIFDHDLSPSQSTAISKFSDLKIIDRSQLILDIFAQRAESTDGKLQVELAQLKYSLPRLGQKDDALSRLTGGIGGRGPGETKLEIGRRRAKERVQHLEEQLRQLGKRRVQRRRRRERGEVPTVAIVGYTNAGKSTLLNTMTGSEVLAEDKLFATLDTRSRTLRVGWAGYGEREVVVTDTVGFIRDLPKDLFAAFRATFEEAADADAIVQVVDASDEARDDHMEATDTILEELGLSSIPQILVFNKVELLDKLQRSILGRKYPGSILLTARDRETTRELLARIATTLQERWKLAAKGPDLAPSDLETAELDSQDIPESPDSASTLDALLARAGRRTKKAKGPSVVNVPGRDDA